MGTYHGKTTSQLKNYVLQAYKNDDKYATTSIYRDYKKSGGRLTLNEICHSKPKRSVNPRIKNIHRDPTLSERKQIIKRYYDKHNMDYAFNEYKQYRRDGGKAKFEDIVKSNKFKTVNDPSGHGFYKIKKRWF